MRICILEPGYEESESPLRDLDPPAEPHRYLYDHDCDRVVIQKRTAVRKLIELSQREYDVFINLCDGAWDEDRPGIEVVQALERLNLPFTGAGSAFYEPTRENMKKVAHYYDVPMPAGVTVLHAHEVAQAAELLRFPLIVKHPNSYSSIGLTKESRVTTLEALREKALAMITEFGSALIEEFIEGREFSVLVAENADDPAAPYAYTPVEFVFPPGESFKHFDMKWRTYNAMTCVPCDDAELAERLKGVSKRLFSGLRGTGYGRTDVRVSEEGDIFVLEINPNCGVFYPPSAEGSADLILEADPDGHPHFIEAILKSAFKRVKVPRPWLLRYREDRGYGMFAARDLAAGDLIEPYEERAHVLVTRTHVENHWRPEQQEIFRRFAYPISDEVYVSWSDEPEDWKPINHSCDPNTWLQGLDLVARRPIAAGEELTMDYATICNEVMAEFKCSCDATNCRGTIRGSDYLQPFIEQYGNHVSPYVRSKRRYDGACVSVRRGAHE